MINSYCESCEADRMQISASMNCVNCFGTWDSRSVYEEAITSSESQELPRKSTCNGMIAMPKPTKCDRCVASS